MGRLLWWINNTLDAWGEGHTARYWAAFLLVFWAAVFLLLRWAPWRYYANDDFTRSWGGSIALSFAITLLVIGFAGLRRLLDR